jgi:hypothetical protein
MAGVPRARTSTLLAAVTLTAALALAACGPDDGGPDHAAAAPAPVPTPPSDPASTTSASPEGTPSSEPSSGPSREPARHGGRHKTGALPPRHRTGAHPLDTHLLDADLLPSVGGRAWTIAASGPEDGGRVVGACQKTALGPIGAVEAVRRTFAADDGVTAAQVVARFADPKSAWRAHEVLVAWREDCATRLAHATVGPLEPVSVRTGAADSYRGSYARSRAAGLGILRTGSYLTVVEVTARSDRYPTSWDPARVAVRRIARTF